MNARMLNILAGDVIIGSFREAKGLTQNDSNILADIREVKHIFIPPLTDGMPEGVCLDFTNLKLNQAIASGVCP